MPDKSAKSGFIACISGLGLLVPAQGVIWTLARLAWAGRHLVSSGLELRIAVSMRLYTYLVGAINLIWIVSPWAIFIRNSERAPSFKSNLILYCAVFTWLSRYAFPYSARIATAGYNASQRPVPAASYVRGIAAGNGRRKRLPPYLSGSAIPFRSECSALNLPGSAIPLGSECAQG
jgi:hypothetical protein